MVFSNVIVDITIYLLLHVTLSSGITNVSGLAVAAIDLAYCKLSVLRSVFVLDISKQLS